MNSIIKIIIFATIIFCSKGLFSQSPSIRCQLKLPKSNYTVMDEFYIELLSNHRMYYYVFNLQSNGDLLLLFPNEHDSNNLLNPGQNRIPSESSDYTFNTNYPVGEDKIIVITSFKKITKLHSSKYSLVPVMTKIKNNELTTVMLHKLTSELRVMDWLILETKINILDKKK